MHNYSYKKANLLCTHAHKVKLLYVFHDNDWIIIIK
jgi:hypothetical protein